MYEEPLMKRLGILILVICTLFPLIARGNNEAQNTSDLPVRIAVSIEPQHYVVDRIAGNLAQTVVLVGPGQSPHSYEPTPRQMAELSQADAWITSNTDFEGALKPKIMSLYPELLVVNGTEGVTFRSLEEHHDDEHDHMEEDESDYAENIDQHTWLGKEPMKILAQKTAQTLIYLDPAHTDTYNTNLGEFLGDIDELFSRLTQELAALAGTTIFVYHPSFGYLLDEFSITQKAVETGGKEPTARALSQLISEAQKIQPPALFVQAQFPVQAAQTIAQSINAQVLPLDPLAYDWIANISLIGETLKQTLVNSDKEVVQ